MIWKSDRRIFPAMFALAALATAMTMAARQEKTAKKPAAPAARPGAVEMERLKFYLGEWDHTETYPKNGAKNTGVYTSKLGPGGNSLINTFHSQGPVGDFEGLLILTWDAREKAYKAYAFGNNFPGALVETGQFEDDALVYRSELSLPGGAVKLRNVTRVTGPGTLVSEEFMTMKDAPETLFVHVEAKKR
jgi:uncharacterized protein DUF1579